MSPLDPKNIATTFSEYVRAGVQILLWFCVSVAALAGTYIVLRMICYFVSLVTKAIGI